ncbi:cytochrome P450 [Dactylonectria macrodidyma]|uniref:Cytochrome P450 n=1 Tax=Dactylonectria macrodidyma TaxID=307937 RepID=A0A9P9JIW2_9HYPO|nr:cytochrome P450 [Dactylonectria macrodidyma]
MYRVPKGATVVANTYAVHHDPKSYQEHHRFIPERFLHEGHPLRAKEMATLSKNFAFGVGRRSCPGLQVANASLYVVLSRILWGFNISAASSGPPRLEPVPSPLVVALALFECSVIPRSEKVRELIGNQAEGQTPPPGARVCFCV